MKPALFQDTIDKLRESERWFERTNPALHSLMREAADALSSASEILELFGPGADPSLAVGHVVVHEPCGKNRPAFFCEVCETEIDDAHAGEAVWLWHNNKRRSRLRFVHKGSCFVRAENTWAKGPQDFVASCGLDAHLVYLERNTHLDRKRAERTARMMSL